MMASAWLAYSCVFFVLLLVWIDYLGRRLGVVGWHYQIARVAVEWSVLGFAVLAALSLFWHLLTR
jgi:hypothetical protein